MGEESTTPVYIGKYEDGAVRFEPLGEFKVIDHDITDVYPDDMVKPMQYVRTIMRDQTITIQGFLSLKDLRGFYKVIGMPAYLRTEYLFPKKKKRGTARRKRKMRVYKQRFIKFINDKYGSGLIGTKATNVIIDEFIISKDELPAFAGPFEGEEN
jgi:hypothetical protein